MNFSNSLLITVFTPLATNTLAQDEPTEVPNPAVDLLSCRDLSYEPSGGSIYVSNDRPSPEVGVRIAAEDIAISSTTLSLTLINSPKGNSFTSIGSGKYEHWDQQLFVGVGPDLDDNEYLLGCCLMPWYLG